MRTTEARRGTALLAVMWLSAALATVAFSLASTVRGETERASTAVEGTRAYYLAAGAVQRTILHMFWTRNNPALPPPYATRGRSFDAFPFPTGEARVEIIPETAKLNINRAPPDRLFRLLANLGVEPGRAEQITAAILDWRAPAPGGAPTLFDQFYLSRNPSFLPRHASLSETEELLLVKGMTPDIYYGTWQRGAGADGGPRLVRQPGLADCVSIFGATDRFDVNTVQPALLAAFGMPPDAIGAIVARRRAEPFRDDADLVRFFQGSSEITARVRVGGNSMFTLRATARMRRADGSLSDLRRTVAAQVKFMQPGENPPYHLLRWYDNGWEGQP